MVNSGEYSSIEQWEHSTVQLEIYLDTENKRKSWVEKKSTWKIAEALL